MLNGFTSSTVLRHQRFYVINGFYVKQFYVINSLKLNWHFMKSSSPCKGSKRRARGRAQRHPGNNTRTRCRPERAKALIINYICNCCAWNLLCFCPFRARGFWHTYSRGAAALCPGLCACCPCRAHIHMGIHFLPL